ncbi:AraC family transcriptional regulator [Sphingorhabdus sp. EL138]|uniref:AraC family transcriptional regulator n=1 Tax=Sphingorhabdus sp. EL138 TaxID=2073156 RepID=UPI000D6903CB|nr:AraC family transcriptional regulator [Sphingorhabdus sp. EL138]
MDLSWDMGHIRAACLSCYTQLFQKQKNNRHHARTDVSHIFPLRTAEDGLAWHITGKGIAIGGIDLALVDTTLRLLTLGGQIMIIAVLLTSRTRRDLKISLLGVLISSMAYLINSSVTLAPPFPWRRAIDFLSISTTVWAWVFAHQLFERRIAKPLLIAVPILLTLLWIVAVTMPDKQWFTFYAIRLLSLALVVHLIIIALTGRVDDLIEKRRRIRMYLPIFVGLQVGGVLTYELFFDATDNIPIVSAINAMLILILVLGAGMAVLTADGDLFSKLTTDKRPVRPVLNLSPSETVLHDKLITAMEEGQYREPSLTIATLASKLDTPEHRLRALINKQLGHRNFSSFLNGYRITEAKEKLSDRAHVDLPILTIAMDLGYGSLAPFNRAFRAETGQTPSDFRKAAIDQN